MWCRQFEGTKHIEQSGFLEIAEASDMILIFPQAVMSEPQNDIGCWDTFGISGELYGTYSTRGGLFRSIIVVVTIFYTIMQPRSEEIRLRQ